MNDWNGRHILIVGASEGIGRETAMLCARRGARLSLAARHDSVKKVAAGLDKKGHQGFCFDVAAIEKIEDFIILKHLENSGIRKVPLKVIKYFSGIWKVSLKI